MNMTDPRPKSPQVYVLKNIGRILLWFIGMLGLLLVAIIIAAIIPDYKNYVYFGVFVLFLFLGHLMVRRMRARVQKQNTPPSK